ncbi:hypothetical protein GC163_03135 [bacterium]|nr:hypothetical protein [bacterium]
MSMAPDSPGPAPLPSQKIVVPSWMARLVWALSGLNLAAVCTVMVLIFVVSERWWFSAALTYLPRAPWALPAVLLSVAGIIWHRPSLWANVVALGMVAGPLMEFRAPWLADARTGPAVPITAPSLRFVTANVQGFQPNFAEVLSEISRQRPDIVVLQEARGEHELLAEFFHDWQHIQIDYYWIGSRFPLKLLHTCETTAFGRVAGLIVEVETPQGPIIVGDVHQMTARRGLKELAGSDLATGEAQQDLDEFQMLRMAESTELREQIRELAGDKPLIIGGDFNTPASSSMFQRDWGDLTCAFDVAGTGYGYTSPVKPQRLWISYVPWARIDHVLCSSHWLVRRCEVGTGRGSDHHIVAAELAR